MATHSHPQIVGAALLWLALRSAEALGAPPPARPAGTIGHQKPASTGVTKLESKFPTVDADTTEDTLEAEAGAGGQVNTGNARSGAFTGQARFRIRRRRYEFSTVMVGNYAQAAERQDDDTSQTRTTAGNIQGRVRHDVYVRSRIALFIMVTARHDPFLGLDLRLRLDPGVALFAINVPKHRLWGEAGYDFLYDLRRIRDGADTSVCPAGTRLVLDIPNAPARPETCTSRRWGATHSVRLFLGYVNNLSEHATLSTGLEYIQSFAPSRSAAADTEGGSDRLMAWVNWEAALTTSLTEKFVFATTFTLRYDNTPLPGVKRLDTITAFNLVYRFF